jgi:hypothetical protein
MIDRICPGALELGGVLVGMSCINLATGSRYCQCHIPLHLRVSLPHGPWPATEAVLPKAVDAGEANPDEIGAVEVGAVKVGARAVGAGAPNKDPEKRLGVLPTSGTPGNVLGTFGAKRDPVTGEAVLPLFWSAKGSFKYVIQHLSGVRGDAFEECTWPGSLHERQPSFAFSLMNV